MFPRSRRTRDGKVVIQAPPPLPDQIRQSIRKQTHQMRWVVSLDGEMEFPVSQFKVRRSMLTMFQEHPTLPMASCRKPMRPHRHPGHDARWLLGHRTDESEMRFF